MFKQVLMKKVTCKTRHFYSLLTFLLLNIALIIAVSIYCYPIKYRTKQNHLSPYHDISKLKETDIKNILSK